MISKLIKKTGNNTRIHIRAIRIFGKNKALKALERMRFFVTRGAGLVC